MSCPSEEQLAGYLLDSQAPDLATVRAHLTTCAACRAWVEEVRQEDDDLQHVRRVLVQEDAPRGVAVQQDALTSAGTSVRIGPGDTTTFSPTTLFAASPEFQEYEIIEELGRGGMGAVYLATQKSTKRKVALKVLLEGPFASASAKRRFEREVELAAQLQHPHIVTILESGIASGRYYFAMQYVEGERLDVYFAPRPAIRTALAAAVGSVPARPAQSGAAALKDAKAGGRGLWGKGPARQAGPTAAGPTAAGPIAAPAVGHAALAVKLRLFQKICEAVNYAHQRGVIHRDLKPSNILIDSAGEPHILDFGLAKIADPQAEKEPIVLSVTGQLMGTLPYMSPEQAMGLHHDIDIRSDVYSLGVMLFELLTGKFPYPVAGKIPDILKNIIETPPTVPSSLNPTIKHEVETITLKALCKERERRYQTAGELGRDLGRYLAGEPIEAKRDSTLYVLGKMLRRYRVPVVAASVFLLVIAAGAFMLTAQRAAHRARERESRAAMRAAELLTAVIDDPGRVVRVIEQVEPHVRQHMADMTGRYLMSAAWPERVMGSRAGLLTQPEVFWKSVDGGPLWRYGEWLEVLSIPWPDSSGNALPVPEVMKTLLDHAANGSDRQKYVALCILGQCRAPQAGDLFVRAARTEPHPGVAAAGLWAARRVGRKVEPPLSQCFFEDEVTGLTFVRVPAVEEFRRGSTLNDPDRIADEALPPKGEAIAAFQLSTTEVTLAAFEAFYREHEETLFGPFARGTIGNLTNIPQFLADTPREQHARTAVSYVSQRAARKYCIWMSRRGATQQPPRRYRLPTESEWEWACRGGNPGRFCYGDDARYARFFAKCEGVQEEQYVVANRMPNFYGLFDMHGGLWEQCESFYWDPVTGEPLSYEDPATGKRFVLYALRGGAFYSPAARCRSAQRNKNTDEGENEFAGFRIVMELEQ